MARHDALIAPSLVSAQEPDLHCMVVWKDGWMLCAITIDVAPGHKQDLVTGAIFGILQKPLQRLKALLCLSASQGRGLTLLLDHAEEVNA